MVTAMLIKSEMEGANEYVLTNLLFISFSPLGAPLYQLRAVNCCDSSVHMSQKVRNTKVGWLVLHILLLKDQVSPSTCQFVCKNISLV